MWQTDFTYFKIIGWGWMYLSRAGTRFSTSWNTVRSSAPARGVDHGSVISSWLLDLTAQALAGDPRLDQFTAAVADSGEGRWTIEAALEEAVPADVLAAAVFARFRSRDTQVFGEKLLSAMRFGFGGHVEEVA